MFCPPLRLITATRLYFKSCVKIVLFLSDACISVFHPGGPPQHKERRSRRRQNLPLPGKLWLKNVPSTMRKRRNSPKQETLTRSLKRSK